MSAVLIALALAGCAPTVATPTSSPAAEPTVAPSTSAPPTATPTPTIGPDVLFTLTATATAVGSNGAKADLVETVYAPVATTDQTAADTAALNAQCSGWQKQYPNRVFLVAAVSSTTEAGSPDWPKNLNIVAVSVDGVAPTAWTGSYLPFEAECAPPIVKIPGQIRGVEVLAANTSPDAKGGWANQRYGFGIASDGSESSLPKKFHITIDNCAITLGPAAQADPIASKWTPGGGACFVGNIG